MPTALLINRVQNDYCDGGPSGITGVLNCIPKINDIRDKFDIIVFIKEKNSVYHNSFKEYGGLDPPHCIKNSHGSELVKWLYVDDSEYIVNIQTLTLHSSNSGFYDAKSIDFKKESRLNSILKENNIDEVFLCGVYVEKYIFPMAIDTLAFKYGCTVITDCCCGENSEKIDKCYEYFKGIDVKLTKSTDLI